jgi:hypothetical protein
MSASTAPTARLSAPSGFGEPYPLVYVDGVFRTADQARLSVLANAVSYGTGTFEGIRGTGTRSINKFTS